MRRWVESLGNIFSDGLSTALTGRFESEEELDSILNDVWLQYQGTSQEDEVGPILEEIKLRAIAIKDSMEMSQFTNLGLPEAEYLSSLAVELKSQ